MNFKLPRNRLGVVRNSYQGNVTKILTVCSAGCLRSPTAATLLSSDPFNFNTRSCGLNEEYAIVPITPTLVVWADIILVMEPWMYNEVEQMIYHISKDNQLKMETTLICLDIEDNYAYMQPELQEIMLEKFRGLEILS